MADLRRKVTVSRFWDLEASDGQRRLKIKKAGRDTAMHEVARAGRENIKLRAAFNIITYPGIWNMPNADPEQGGVSNGKMLD